MGSERRVPYACGSVGRPLTRSIIAEPLSGNERDRQ